MMKIFFCLIFLLEPLIFFGQFAVVADNDGFVNVRNHGRPDSKIIDTLKNGHLIYCFENNGNWTNIDYSKNRLELSGYLYHNRYTFIRDFIKIPLVNESKNSVAFKLDSIEITVTQRVFEKHKHRFTSSKDNPGMVEKIDNKKYWGTDGEMPTTQYHQIIVRIGSKKTIQPVKATSALYQPSLFNVAAFFDQKRNIIYVESMNSDGAGAYEVLWKIENGIYIDRLVAYGF